MDRNTDEYLTEKDDESVKSEEPEERLRAVARPGQWPHSGPDTASQLKASRKMRQL